LYHKIGRKKKPLNLPCEPKAELLLEFVVNYAKNSKLKIGTGFIGKIWYIA
jgi:hypothetical protein